MTLRGYRANVNLTQDDVAKHLGLCRESYRLKEQGKKKLSLEEGVKLSEIFKVTLEDIYNATKS